MITSMIRSQAFEVLVLCGAGKIRECQIPRFRGDLPLFHAIVEGLLGTAEPFVEEGLLDLENDRLVARCRAHLRDP